MDKFTVLTGVAAPLPIVNVDTDMIIPKQYLKTIKRTGLGGGLFAEMRYRDDGSENPDFVLNRPAYRRAQILVAGDNFGCGSSREHAPWALMAWGIRAVISSGFADIFRNNALKNGLLPVAVSPEELGRIGSLLEADPSAELTVDLESQEIRLPGEGRIGFEVDSFARTMILAGTDELGYLQSLEPQIAAYEASHPPRVSTLHAG